MVMRASHGSRSIWTDAYDEFGAEVLEYVDADPWVICDARWYGKGKGSGTPVEVRSADAYLIIDGKVARVLGGNADMPAAREAVERAR